MRTECPSFSKVNIGLKILDKRNDGYHNINTIFQELEFGDYVTIDEIANGCEVISNVTWIPSNKNNICYKAYYELSKKFPNLNGVRISIEKNVPVGSGLGGGSANAAAALKGICKLFDLGLSENDLESIGVKIGADVPFFIRGGVQFGEGIGEKLTKIKNPIPGFYLLVMPNIKINTNWAYSQFKNQLNSDKSLTKFPRFLVQDFSSPKFFENDFERIVIPAYPEIGKIKKKILNFGASFASLSGSGSTVYGIFNDEAFAKDAELFFRNSHNTILSKPKQYF